MSPIEWTHDGRRVLLPISILRPSPATDLTAVSVTALVDTGATVSGIATRVIRELDLPPVGRRPLNTVLQGAPCPIFARMMCRPRGVWLLPLRSPAPLLAVETLYRLISAPESSRSSSAWAVRKILIEGIDRTIRGSAPR